MSTRQSTRVKRPINGTRQNGARRNGARNASHTAAASRKRTKPRPSSQQPPKKSHSSPKRVKPPKIVFVNREDRRYRISFRLLFTIFLIFVGGVGSAFSYAVINDVRAQLSQARRDLSAQREDNAALRAEITQKFTLDEVERIAIERLGMNKPDASQIVHIDVPKQSYVVLNDEVDAPEAVNYFWNGIVSFFISLFE